MSKLKMFAFDYDRVLTTSSLTFDYRIIPLLKELKQKNAIIGIVTGRRWMHIEHMKSNVDFIIYENGYFIYISSKNLRIKLFEKWQENLAKELMELLKENHIPFIKGELLISIPIEESMKCSKILEPYMDKIDIVSNIDRIMVLVKNVNKGNALKYALDFFKVQPSELMVFGDGENDYDMFEITENGATIGNSVPKLRSRSKFHSEKLYSDGTAEILNKILESDLII
ncbi:MAG: HAD family hydrolase [Thermoplasmata archaeon]